MHPHFIIFDCSLLLNPEQASYAPLSPLTLCSVWTEILLRREQDWGKINDMSYISLFRYVFTKPFVCVWVCVPSYVCLSVSSLNRQGLLTHQHVFLITILHSSVSPQLAAGASRLCATAADGAVSHEATTHSACWGFPCPSGMYCMSICLSEEATLLKDGNVISSPFDPKVAAMQPPFHAGWYVKCVPYSLSTNTWGKPINDARCGCFNPSRAKHINHS